MPLYKALQNLDISEGVSGWFKLCILYVLHKANYREFINKLKNKN